MTNTSEFEIELLKEKNHILGSMKDLGARLLSITYLDKKLALAYYDEVERIINDLDAEYEGVRNRGKTTK